MTNELTLFVIRFWRRNPLAPDQYNENSNNPDSNCRKKNGNDYESEREAERNGNPLAVPENVEWGALRDVLGGEARLREHALHEEGEQLESVIT